MGPIVIDVDPAIFRIGHFALRWYGFFIAVAIFVGFVIALREARRKGVSEDDVFSIGTWGVIGGIVGARLLHVIDRWPEYSANPSAILAFQEGGLAIYGAILGGVAAGSLCAYRRRLSISRIADMAAPGLVLAQAIGRIGCLFNGDALGAPTSLPWGLAYANPEAMVPQLGVAYQPTPAYEMIGDLLIFALLWKVRRRLKTDGSLFLTYLLLYSGLKFSVTFARQEAIFLAGFQEAQVVSALGGLVAAALLVYLRQRQPIVETAGSIPLPAGGRRAQAKRR